MKNTKEKILSAALFLFAKYGYEPVTVEQITTELGLVKSSIYKHFSGKRDIFNQILVKMAERDFAQAMALAMPVAPKSENQKSYQNLSLENIAEFCKTMFDYWTTDKFAMDFRRLLTLEQYRNPEAAELFTQYLGQGPVDYMADIFEEIIKDKHSAKIKATELYALMYFGYELYDKAKNKKSVKQQIHSQIDDIVNRVEKA